MSELAECGVPIKHINIVYVGVEDRIRLTVLLADGRSEQFWVTRRLWLKMLGPVSAFVEQDAAKSPSKAARHAYVRLMDTVRSAGAKPEGCVKADVVPCILMRLDVTRQQAGKGKVMLTFVGDGGLPPVRGLIGSAKLGSWVSLLNLAARRADWTR